MKLKLLGWLLAGLVATVGHAQATYNYFAPGGALSCTAPCKQQSVNLGSGSFITSTLAATNFPILSGGDCTTPGGSFALTCTKTNGVAFAPSATTDTTNAANITSGILVAGRGGTGSGGTPTSAQIPIGNAGGTAYAPQSITGDGSLSNTGALVVSKTSGVSFAPSATTDTTNATNILSGTLAVTRGGTGLGTLTTHGVLLGEGTANVAAVSALAADNLLLGQGASADPAATALTNCGDSTHALAYSTGTHTFSCQTIVGSAGTPGGATTQVQFNLTGAFAGDAGFTYVGSTTQTLTLGTAANGPTLAARAGTTTGTTFNITGSAAGGSASNGGQLVLTAGAGGATSGTGGQTSLKGGAPAGTGTGGAVVITGGAAGSAAGNAGGGITINAGTGTATTTGAAGAAVQLSGAAATGSGNNNGGAITLTGGAATGSGNGGVLTFNGGTVGTAITNGYRNVILQGGATSANITTGSGTNSATSSVYIAGSTAAISGINGGDVLITGGLPNATTSTGGNVLVRSGGTNVASSNGNIIFQGVSTSTGQPVTYFTLNGNNGALGVNGASFGTAGQFLVSNGTAAAPTWSNTSANALTALGYIANGSISVSGCSLSGAAGGQTAGKFASGTTGTCTVTVTLPTAPTGWACRASDLTTVADLINQTATAVGSCTISGTTVSGDVIVFSALGF